MNQQPPPIHCFHCGLNYHPKHPKCPRCGAPRENPKEAKKSKLPIIIIGVILVAVIGYFLSRVLGPVNPTRELQMTRFSDLPFEIPYEDTFIKVYDIECYESYYNYQYTPYIIVHADLGALSDKQRHYVWEDVDDSMGIYDSDGEKVRSMSRIYKVYFEDTQEQRLYFMSSFFSEDNERNSHAGQEVRLRFDIKSPDKSYHDPFEDPSVQYKFKFPDKPLDPEEAMEKIDYDYYIKGMNSFAEALEGR